MEWVERLNESIRYLEQHLTGEIDYGRLGQIACCSGYHYQRMFTYMTGVPLSEYIRRRRMSLAAAELQNGQRVVDVAIKYGYSSPTAFNRAFQAVHGLPPSAVRNKSAAVKAYPPITFKIEVKGVEEMEYRIEKREAFRVVGVSIPLEKDIEKNFAVVPGFWDKAAREGTIPRLAALMDAPPMGLLGVCGCEGEEDWRYYIAVATSKPAERLEEYTVPAATWAIFSGGGPNVSIQELERRAVAEWLPTSGYEYAQGPDIEVYLSPDPQNARYELWIPVTKKK